MRTPPMVTVVGRKHSGKTTLLVRLAAELHRRGHRVSTLKHGSHTFNLDPATTDTYRHYHEGRAERVAMASPDKFALVERWSEELQPEEIARRYLADADVVVCEGFKASTMPKVEVFRPVAHATMLYARGDARAAEWRAIVTDAPLIEADVPVFHFSDPDWLGALATLVEREIIGAP